VDALKHCCPGVLKVATCYLMFLFVLLAVALPHGLDTPLSLYSGHPTCTQQFSQIVFSCQSTTPLTPLSTVDDIVRVYQLNDPASLARAAKSGASVAAFWPPGLVILLSAMYSVSINFPVGVVLVFISCALWAGVLTLIVTCFLKNTGSVILSIVPAFLFIGLVDLGKYDIAYLVGTGVFSTETYSTALFLMGIGLLAIQLEGNSLNIIVSIVSGAILAIAAYFRAQFDIIMVVATMLFLLIAAVRFTIINVIRRPFQRKIRSPLRALQSILVVLITYHACTFPYRLTHYWSWIDTSNNGVWKLVWDRPEEIPPELAFVVQSGLTAGCVVDPDLCDALNQRRALPGTPLTNNEYRLLTFRSFLYHPAAWVRFKLPFFVMALSLNGNLLLLVAFLLIVLTIAFVLPLESLQILAFFLLATIGGVLAPLLLIHMEDRYILPISMLIQYSAVLALGLNSGATQRSGSSGAETIGDFPRGGRVDSLET